MNKTLENMKDLCNKYGFKFEEEGIKSFIMTKNTDGKYVKWITYNSDTDMVSLLGNTDNCNIWFYTTKPDFIPSVCISLVKDINEAFMFSTDDKFRLKDLIDPEDWQEIAGISDAYEDIRYKM